MKPQSNTNTYSNTEKTPIPAALTRALRQAIQADKLGSVLFAAGAKKLRGTPTEVLEEVAAVQTAAWIVGFESGPMNGPAPKVTQVEALEVAVDAIDPKALSVAGALVGIRGATEIDNIRSHLALNLVSTAIEATRFAVSEDRPVCHNCVAIGGSSVARSTLQASFLANQPLAINR